MYFWMQKYWESDGLFEYEFEMYNQKEDDLTEAYIQGKALIQLPFRKTKHHHFIVNSYKSLELFHYKLANQFHHLCPNTEI